MTSPPPQRAATHEWPADGRATPIEPSGCLMLPLRKPAPVRPSHPSTNAPHVDVVYIADGARPPKPRTIVVPKVDPDEQAARLAAIRQRRQREDRQRRDAERQRIKDEARPVLPDDPTKPKLAEVLAVVCKTLGLGHSDLLSTRRGMEAFGREMVAYLARTHTSATMTEIGVTLGKSHVCVCDACSRVQTRRELVVGLFYRGDRVTRWETMTYGAVVEEIEAALTPDHPVADAVPVSRIADIEARLRARGMLAGGAKELGKTS